jgi:hypothetical protein
MGSGAYTVDISPLGLAVGINRLVRRVVPLPPAQNSGTIKYGDVFLSLAAATAMPVDITILTEKGKVALGTFNLTPGRTVIRKIEAGDCAADVSFTTTATAQLVTALVEYTAPWWVIRRLRLRRVS